jgi:hypothetical protein
MLRIYNNKSKILVVNNSLRPLICKSSSQRDAYPKDIKAIHN